MLRLFERRQWVLFGSGLARMVDVYAGVDIASKSPNKPSLIC